MTEWNVVLVIITLLGLIGVLVKPMLKLNTVLTEFSIAIKTLEKYTSEFTTSNSEAHRRLWSKNTEQDALLSKHCEELHNHSDRLNKVERFFDE